MDSGETFIVEACSWDLTMGVATNVFGKLFLRSTSSSSGEIPEAIDHVGIIVHNRLYEYGFNGITKSTIPRNGEDPIPQYPGCKLRKREILGSTRKPRHKFVEWLVNVKYETFKDSNYDVVNHNCLDFARAVCKFLGVAPSQNWEKVSNWVKANQKLTDYLIRGFTRGQRQLVNNRRASSLQENGTTGANDNDNMDPLSNASNSLELQASSVVVSAPPRRRFSVSSIIMSRGERRRLRSASMETLPPTYEEALRMSSVASNGRESAPKYEYLEGNTQEQE